MANIDDILIDTLLYEAEGEALDFKRDQYPFVGATDDDKSELLKDILALANSWRRTDGYLLIGIDEVKDGKSRIVGVQHDLNDAQLQQFVNSKTYRPVVFSYRSVKVGTARVGVIHVPLQQRPHSLRKDYGRLRRNVVYVRRGSATVEAAPDEVVRMSADQRVSGSRVPELSLHLGDSQERSLLEGVPVFRIGHVTAPESSDIPDYRADDPPFVGTGHARPDFYRELVQYYRVKRSVAALGFAVRNDGDVVAENVTVEFTLDDAEHGLVFLTDDQIPEQPESRSHMYHLRGFAVQRPAYDGDIAVHRLRASWQVIATFGRIRPKETVWTDNRLWVAAASSRILRLPGRILADNMPMPPTLELQIDLQVTDESLSLEDATRLHRQDILAEIGEAER